MKRVGYPEDSTQSAYSSQLIRIPLSAIIFYLSCFISREATTRQCWGGDQNQLLGGGWTSADTHKYTLSYTFQNDAVCIRYDDESFTGSIHLSVDTNFQCFLSICLVPPLSGPTASRLRQSEWKSLLSAEADKRTVAQQSSLKAYSFNLSKKRKRGKRRREALGWENSAN